MKAKLENKILRFFKNIDLDVFYQWSTFILIPLFVFTAELKNEIFFFYLVLAVFKIIKEGYKKSGLEIVFCMAIIGLLISSFDVGSNRIRVVKDCLRVARIISLPILMYQFKQPGCLKSYLIILFGGLATYGALRMCFCPIVQGYSDREFCFADFYMNSSVISFSGYLFFLVLLLRSQSKRIAGVALLNILIFMYLIVLQGVRASYLAFFLITPLVALVELKQRVIRFLPVIALLICGIVILIAFSNADIVGKVKERVVSIADLNQGSNSGRLRMWKKAIDVFKDNYINGVGYKQFNKRNFQLSLPVDQWAFWHAHNEYFAMLAETGLIGIITWSIFKLQLLFILFKRRKVLVGAFILYFLIAFEIHNLFEVYLFERTSYIYTYMLIGLCFVPKEELENKGE